ncbi:Hypothetical predicted protein, partial [Marmota monax]
VAKQLKEQQMVMRGHRETSMVHELNRQVQYPPPVSRCSSRASSTGGPCGLQCPCVSFSDHR